MRSVLVNPERCIGCRHCEFECAVAHSQSLSATLAPFEQPVPVTRVHVEPGRVPTTSFPSLCRHCDPAPCERVCPTGAIRRDADGGWVLIDEARCIGCAMCAVVCPFDVITFHPPAERGDAPAVAVKCDGCAPRVRRGEAPACVEVCKVGALVFGDLNDLVASGRLREAGAALAAASTGADVTGRATAGWRAWGEAQARALTSPSHDGARTKEAS